MTTSVDAPQRDGVITSIPLDQLDPCHEWTGYRQRRRGGYGQVAAPRAGAGRRAHRVAWVEAFGPIPEGMFVCHHCDNPPCINPDHLFLGTALDNNRDMALKGRRVTWQERLTHCPQGHPYSETNTYRDRQGGRVCRACSNEHSRRYHRERRRREARWPAALATRKRRAAERREAEARTLRAEAAAWRPARTWPMVAAHKRKAADRRDAEARELRAEADAILRRSEHEAERQVVAGRSA